MKVIFMGTPEFSVPVLESLINSDFEVVLVVTQPDKQVGRGRKVKFNPVKELAISKEIELYQPENINEHTEYICNIRPDFIVTCAYGQILCEDILNCAAIKSVNVHASLLPAHRGGAPIHRSILNGDKYTGITIMEMIPMMDAGDIFFQKKVEILESDSLATLHDKLSKVGSEMIVESLQLIASNNFNSVKQDEEKVTYSPNILKEERQILFDDEAINIFNKIRAFNPYPCAYANYDGKLIKIYESLISNSESKEVPGTIVDITKQGIEVATLTKNIIIKKLQLPGKKVVDAPAFYNGNKLIEKGNLFSKEAI